MLNVTARGLAIARERWGVWRADVVAAAESGDLALAYGHLTADASCVRRKDRL